MKLLSITLLSLMLSSSLCAETKIEFPTAGERKAANVVSWITALTAVAVDTHWSIGCPDRKRCFTTQAIRIGAVYGSTYAIKAVVDRKRPCYPECGTDNPNGSFPSQHTALAFSIVGGPRLAITIPLGAGTGAMRVGAGRHWVTDTLAGAGIGLALSRIR